MHIPADRTHVVNGPDIVSKFLGESEKNLRELFGPAIKAKKEKGAATYADELHLVVFDEIDAICRPRGAASDQAVGLVYDGLVNQLLSLLDGVDALDNVLVVGMTNRKDLIDPALLRPGRFEVDQLVSGPPPCLWTAPQRPRCRLLGLRPLLCTPGHRLSSVEACRGVRSPPQAAPKRASFHCQPPGGPQAEPARPRRAPADPAHPHERAQGTPRAQRPPAPPRRRHRLLLGR